MENDQVFAAEADIETRFGHDPSLRHAVRHRVAADGRKPLAAASTSRKRVNQEDTPLLAREEEDEDDDASTGHDGDNVQTEEPSWPGERDFEGKPWWNRPSVGISFPCGDIKQ